MLSLSMISGSACTEVDPDRENDVLVVVIETNTPCNDELCPPCELAFEYEFQLTRNCSPGSASVEVCSPEPVCDEALDDLMASLSTCGDDSVDLSLCD